MEAKTPFNPANAGNPAAPAKPKVVIAPYDFRRDGMPRIRKPLLTFVITVVLCACMVGGARFMLAKVAPATALAQQARGTALERYQQAENERVAFRDFQPAFELLRTRGFYGPESRLQMVDAIKSIQVQRKLLPLSYTFSPQRVVAVDPTLLEATMELHSTRVVVRMQLLHEMDLVNFFDDLRLRGFYTVRECKIIPIDVAPDAAVTARLSADCTLYWLTVAAAPGEPPPQ